MPRPRPPFPVDRRLVRITHGREQRAVVQARRTGRPQRCGVVPPVGNRAVPGTLVCSVSGAVNDPRNVEVPLGTTVGEVLELAGGVDDRGMKAFAPGGWSTPMLPGDRLDAQMDYEGMVAAGYVLGASSIIAVPNDMCIVRAVGEARSSIRTNRAASARPVVKGRTGSRHARADRARTGPARRHRPALHGEHQHVRLQVVVCPGRVRGGTGAARRSRTSVRSTSEHIGRGCPMSRTNRGGRRMTESRKQRSRSRSTARRSKRGPVSCLIEAAERAGIFMPRFCWHKRMDPVRACRMCLVDVEGSPPIPGTAAASADVVHDRCPRWRWSCTRSTRPSRSTTAQKTILELLLINHPLDCPICDRGGECPLQDQTQDYGPNESKFLEPKRRFREAGLDLAAHQPRPRALHPLLPVHAVLRGAVRRRADRRDGARTRSVHLPLLLVRNERRAGTDTPRGTCGVRGPRRGDISETFDSYFSGNTVQICPVGALTSPEYRFKSRPWDLQVVATTCNLCASGCALHAGVHVQDGNVVRFSGATGGDE